jgi:hypothetical protein
MADVISARFMLTMEVLLKTMWILSLSVSIVAVDNLITKTILIGDEVDIAIINEKIRNILYALKQLTAFKIALN